jgi:tetratricopeptide (TPR) repeat protein
MASLAFRRSFEIIPAGSALRLSRLILCQSILIVSAAAAQTPAAIDSADALVAAGREFFYSHRYVEAFDRFHQAQIISPHDPEIIYESAWALFQMGRYTESAETANEAPFYQTTLLEETYSLISEAYKRSIGIAIYEHELSQRSLDEVATFIEFALQSVEGVDRLYKLGFTFLDRADSARALMLFEIALTLQPDLDPAHQAIGLIYDQQGRYRDAALAYTRLLSLATDYPFASRMAIMLDNALRRMEGDTTIATTSAAVRPLTPERLSRLLDMPTPVDSVAERLYLRWLQEADEQGFLPTIACDIARITNQQKEPADCESNQAYRLWAELYLVRSTREVDTPYIDADE